MHDAPRPGSIPAAAESKSLGQVAHEAGERAGHWARKWSDLGEAQKAEWEEIGAAVARAALAAPKAEAWNYPSAGQPPSPDEVVFCAWTTHQGGFEYDVACMNEYGLWGDPEDPHDTSYYPPAAWHRPAPPISPAPQEESHD